MLRRVPSHTLQAQALPCNFTSTQEALDYCQQYDDLYQAIYDDLQPWKKTGISKELMRKAVKGHTGALCHKQCHACTATRPPTPALRKQQAACARDLVICVAVYGSGQKGVQLGFYKGKAYVIVGTLKESLKGWIAHHAHIL